MMNAFAQRRTQLIVLFGGFVLLAIGVFVFARSQTEAYEFHGGEITPAATAPPLESIDFEGNPFTIDREAGKVALIYFGYTTCPDLCPTTLNDFAIVKDDLGDTASDVRFIMATFDPERDTQERLKEYLNFFDPDFVGLRGNDDQTEQFLEDYGVTIDRVDYPNSSTGYLIDHTSLIYVIDKDGRLRLTYTYGTDPLLIAEDIRHLINE